MGLYLFEDENRNVFWIYDRDGLFFCLVIAVILLPFFLLFSVVSSAAFWVTENFMLAIFMFFAVNAILSWFLSLNSKFKYEFWMQATANFILFGTVFATLILYGIPYVVQKNSVWNSFELIISGAVNVGVVILLKAVGKLHRSALGELVTAIVFVLIYCAVMYSALGSSMTPEIFQEIYHLRGGLL